MNTLFLYFSLILLVFPARETGFAQAQVHYKRSFTLYSCPLRYLASSSSNRACLSSSSSSNFPYGLRHTYIQIGHRCHDWGDWNYPRNIDCSHADLHCCVETSHHEFTEETWCAYRILEFEVAWWNQNRNYNIIYRNCQIYSRKMAEFLRNCNLSEVFPQETESV
ncbi:uncharacterized protein LOC132747166 [Ruditapes philippinarum]|uniref:uncharacterized protein LOC132747166 n=1 Tax=Ruditapes philippinarum TaxID=129788 RepID=UPI00295B82A1|nr:uncharacterized protein LOC132747166 [Ruditapes philippinarum]